MHFFIFSVQIYAFFVFLRKYRRIILSLIRRYRLSGTPCYILKEGKQGYSTTDASIISQILASSIDIWDWVRNL